MTISQSREEGKGLLFFSPAKTDFFLPLLFSLDNKQDRRDRQPNRVGASSSSEINLY
jgi:hypothetical protein